MHDFEKTYGIFQGDLIIKTVIELCLEDMRQNPWVIDDVFRSLIENPLLRKKYGLKEVTRAREFILNNEIPIYMKNRLDKQDFPCITIAVGASQEDKSLATLGDLDVEVEEYSPQDIGATISYIIPPFEPTSYDSVTGIIEIPDSIEEYKYISNDMVVADPETGNGYIIQGKAGNHGIQIAAGTILNAKKLAIVPRYQTLRARRERAISQEKYNIGCHVSGDPTELIFLHSVIKYALYRYREGLLEHNNFQLSRLASTDMVLNESFGIEHIYSRWISLTGQVEESWIKTPFRVIEAIDFIAKDEEFQSGIRICAKETPDNLKEDFDVWATVEPDEDSE